MEPPTPLLIFLYKSPCPQPLRDLDTQNTWTPPPPTLIYFYKVPCLQPTRDLDPQNTWKPSFEVLAPKPTRELPPPPPPPHTHTKNYREKDGSSRGRERGRWDKQRRSPTRTYSRLCCSDWLTIFRLSAVITWPEKNFSTTFTWGREKVNTTDIIIRPEIAGTSTDTSPVMNITKQLTTAAAAETLKDRQQLCSKTAELLHNFHPMPGKDEHHRHNYPSPNSRH